MCAQEAGRAHRNYSRLLHIAQQGGGLWGALRRIGQPLLIVRPLLLRGFGSLRHLRLGLHRLPEQAQGLLEHLIGLGRGGIGGDRRCSRGAPATGSCGGHELAATKDGSSDTRPCREGSGARRRGAAKQAGPCSGNDALPAHQRAERLHALRRDADGGVGDAARFWFYPSLVRAKQTNFPLSLTKLASFGSATVVVLFLATMLSHRSRIALPRPDAASELGVARRAVGLRGGGGTTSALRRAHRNQQRRVCGCVRAGGWMEGTSTCLAGGPAGTSGWDRVGPDIEVRFLDLSGYSCLLRARNLLNLRRCHSSRLDAFAFVRSCCQRRGGLQPARGAACSRRRAPAGVGRPARDGRIAGLVAELRRRRHCCCNLTVAAAACRARARASAGHHASQLARGRRLGRIPLRGGYARSRARAIAPHRRLLRSVEPPSTHLPLPRPAPTHRNSRFGLPRMPGPWPKAKPRQVWKPPPGWKPPSMPIVVESWCGARAPRSPHHTRALGPSPHAV